MFFYINSALYHSMNAGILALAGIIGIKTYSKYWLCVTQGLMLLAVASIALAYNEGVLLDITVPFYEYGWLWGILFILTSLTFEDSDKKAMAKWSDIRVKLVWIIFVSNVTLIGTLYATKIFYLQNATQLTSLLFILYALWTLSNILAFKISDNLNNLFKTLETREDPRTKTTGKLFFNEIEQFADKLHSAYMRIEEQAKLTAIGELSAQVAHDIRSPLAALDVVLKDLSALPREKQELARGAVGRIGEIAKDLLENHKKPAGKKSTIKTPVASHNLRQLIEPILAEKRVQYSSKPEIVIEFVNLAGDTEANLKPVEFQRIISNLINNAIESFEKRGRVIIELFNLPSHALLKVVDNGKGIPSEILYKLGQKGETHGKAGGNGLGLYHARTMVESWGGSFKIESEFGKGTAVLLELPRVNVKATNHTAVLLDDDMLVHMNWKMVAKTAKVALKAYSKPEGFTITMENMPKDTPVYIDSDLGNGIKGEDIAKDLYNKGFSDITMTTGHSPEKFAHLPWLKVSGKEPPWAA